MNDGLLPIPQDKSFLIRSFYIIHWIHGEIPSAYSTAALRTGQYIYNKDMYLTETNTYEDYADDLVLLTNTSAKA